MLRFRENHAVTARPSGSKQGDDGWRQCPFLSNHHKGLGWRDRVRTGGERPTLLHAIEIDTRPKLGGGATSFGGGDAAEGMAHNAHPRQVQMPGQEAIATAIQFL